MSGKGKVKMGAHASADIEMNQQVRAGVRIGGRFQVECYDRDGNLKWTEDVRNIIVNVGLDNLLAVWAGATAKATWYVGLKDTGTPVAGDTMSSHASWAELSAIYSQGTRPEFVDGSVSGQSIDNSASKAQFSITSGDDVYGAFLCTDSTKGGTGGVLICAVDFSAPRTVINGDTLNVTYTLTAADDAV